MVSFAADQPDQRMNSATSRPIQPVHLPVQHMAEHAADEHGRRSDHIITASCAVARRAVEPMRRLSPPQNSAIHSFTRMEAPRTANSEPKTPPARVQDLFEGRARQLRADKQNQHRDEQAGKILHARMAERMLLIRRPLRQAEPSSVTSEEAGVREIVRRLP